MVFFRLFVLPFNGKLGWIISWDIPELNAWVPIGNKSLEIRINMGISSGRTGYVLFVDLRKEVNSLLSYFYFFASKLSIYTTIHDERKSQVGPLICFTKTEGYLLSNDQILMKRTQRDRIPNKGRCHYKTRWNRFEPRRVIWKRPICFVRRYDRSTYHEILFYIWKID